MRLKRIDQIRGNDFPRHIYHITECKGSRNSMSYDYRAINAQHRSTPIYLIVKVAKELVLYSPLLTKELINGLRHLQHHIANKAFTDNDICLITKEIAALYVSGKIDIACFFKQWKGGLRQYITLAFFFTNIQEANSWVLFT